MKKIVLIDELKGAAIILVVLGHAISGCIDVVNKTTFWSYLYYLVESFQMPLFFCISGFLFSYVEVCKYINYIDVIKKKLIDIAIPYIMGTLIYVIVGNLIGNTKYSLTAFGSIWHKPISHFWFLYIQLIIYMFSFVYIYLFAGKRAGICMAGGILWAGTDGDPLYRGRRHRLSGTFPSI